MHEWALAEGVVVSALDEMKKNGGTRLKKIRMRVGELQRLEMDAFSKGLEAAFYSHRPATDSVEVETVTEAAALRCRACGKEWLFRDSLETLSEERAEFVHFVPEAARAFLRCPACGSPDFEAVRGRGVWLDSLEAE